MLYKDLPERVQKIAQIEIKRIRYGYEIKNYDTVGTLFTRSDTRQWNDCRMFVHNWDYTLIDKRLETYNILKEKAKGKRKPIGVKYKDLPNNVRDILLRFDIKTKERKKKPTDYLTLLELIDFEKSKIPRDVVEKANIWEYKDILEWHKNTEDQILINIRF